MSDMARPGTDEAPRGGDDWMATQNAATTNPGAAAAWFVLMALLLAGFALMGASFAQDNGLVFAAGLVVSGLAFLIPLGILGRSER